MTDREPPTFRYDTLDAVERGMPLLRKLAAESTSKHVTFATLAQFAEALGTLAHEVRQLRDKQTDSDASR